MDTPQTTSVNSIAPAQLWIGFNDALEQQAIGYAQQLFCKSQGCGYCIICNQISSKQHPSLLWVHPEKNYTVEDIEPIGHKIAFALDKEEHFFFILTNADFLTPVCANSLLKSMEEPPIGYHFILLAQRIETILPTIKSRCLIKTFQSQPPITSSDLYDYFISTAPATPSSFLTVLDQSKISERESVELLDALLRFWIDKLKTASVKNDVKQGKEAEKVVELLNQAIAYPPMPGSSKMLWKNLFLHIKN
jgi:DNA polymerase III gamma/tau subunit